MNIELRKEDAPMTVANVAKQIGVATSTLRTWERRYGIAPSAYTVGGHRRYTKSDIAKLHIMRALMNQGVPAKVAAKKAQMAKVDDCADKNADVPTMKLLLTACQECDDVTAEKIIRFAIQEYGMEKAWRDIFKPVILELDDSINSFHIAYIPQQRIRDLINKVVYEIVGELNPDSPITVNVISDLENAHIAALLGGELKMQGINSQQLSTNKDVLPAVLDRSIASLGTPESPCPDNYNVFVFVKIDYELIEQISPSFTDAATFISVSNKTYKKPINNVTRLHSMRAAISEICALNAVYGA